MNTAEKRELTAALLNSADSRALELIYEILIRILDPETVRKTKGETKHECS